MEHSSAAAAPARRHLLPALTFVLAVLAFLWLYRIDNKYTRGGPQAVNGVLLLSEQTAAEHPVLFLVDDWEYYGDRLLSPQDFAGQPPPVEEYVFIGQYGGFEREGGAASPHGSATYRLNIMLPEQPRQYQLELPELFSAHRVYINGRLVSQLGDPSPGSYRPETGSLSVGFEAGGRAELIVAVSDFSHLYSGMVYPPAFGRPRAVTALLSARLLFRGALCATAATVGLLSLLSGLLRKNRRPLLFALLCLLFLGYAGYPLWRSFSSGFYPFYAVENLCFCAMLLTVMLIRRGGDGPLWRGPLWERCFLGLGVLACAATLAVHLSLPAGALWIMRGYSLLISLYQWATAACLTLSSLGELRGQTTHSIPLLCGALIFDAALIMDRLLPLYEPVVTGWFAELASFALVLCIGMTIAWESAEQYRKNTVLQERAHSAERLWQMRENYYSLVRKEAEDARTARHDLRHHLVAIGGLVQGQHYEQLSAYVAEYAAGIAVEQPLRHCDNEVVNALIHYYDHLARRHNIALSTRLKVPRELPVAATDLGGLLSNLLENAVEACQSLPGGTGRISLAVGLQSDMLAIHMENSAQPPPAPRPPQEGRGYGLASVRATAQRYGGAAEFRYDPLDGVFVSTVLLGLSGALPTQ